MKITITGSLGNISRPLTKILVTAGHQVTVISRNAERQVEIEAQGAKAAIGSVEDTDFLTKQFSGADAVYAMVPPNFAATDYRAYFNQTAQGYATAIGQAGVKKVVFLSSMGAHLQNGTGPIAGLYDAERILNSVEGTSVVTLRPGFFYTNYYNDIGMIKHAVIIGSNYGADVMITLVHPEDIARAAAEKLTQHAGGNTVVNVASDQRRAVEIASVLGDAIGKPGLNWVKFENKDALSGMLQAGFSEHLAKLYIEMGDAIDAGIIWTDFKPSDITPGGKTLEQFAVEFAEKYKQG